MKSVVFIFLIAFAVLFSTEVSAQTGTGLEFSRVVFIAEDVTGFPFVSQTYSVPAGKVWKIEAAGSGDSSFRINEINGIEMSADITSGGSNNEGQNTPIWLSEGTTINFFEDSGSFGFYVSILEFTVTN